MNLFNDGFFFLGQIVLQPTTVCNLDCSYCYLPTRNKNLRMNRIVTERLAQGIAELNFPHRIPLIWHGGEPLAYKMDQFTTLIEPFEDLRKSGKIIHSIQTNGTLINDGWCNFFERYNFQVGVSIDGPQILNVSRKDWQGKEAFTRIMQGIATLRRNKIPFICLAVVTEDALTKTSEIYDFFCNLGCELLGINIEEKVGIHSKSIDGDTVAAFWNELLAVWEKQPSIQIREFRNVIQWLGSLGAKTEVVFQPTDIFPCVSWDGNVVTLSPEFLGIKSSLHGDFVVGNLLQDDFGVILKRAENMGYVQDHRRGIEKCQSECRFFEYCRGGQASNKFFELGRIDGSETLHCRNSYQKPVEAVLRLF